MRNNACCTGRSALQFCYEWRLFDYILCAVIGLSGWIVARTVQPFCRPFSWTDTSLAGTYGGQGTFPSWTLILISVLPVAFYILVEAIRTFVCVRSCATLEEFVVPSQSTGDAEGNHSPRGGPQRRRPERRDLTGTHTAVAVDNTSPRDTMREVSEGTLPVSVSFPPPRQMTKRLLFFYICNHWALAQAFSVALTMCIVDLLKVYAGRLRPDFLARLEREGYSPSSVGVNWCAVARNGRLSFPSGHSGISFAAFVTLTMYCMSQLGAFRGGSLWRFIIGMIPLFLPFMVAVSRTRDNRHHFSDIVAGSIIGATSAILAVRLLFVHSPKTGTLRVRQLDFVVKRSEVSDMDDLV